MRKGIGLFLAAVAMAVFGLAGCNKQAVSSSEAIQHANTLKTPKQQADYLVGRAQAFLNADDSQEAITTAQYVLASVDSHSLAATELLQQAQAKLAADTQAVLDDAKKPVGL